MSVNLSETIAELRSAINERKKKHKKEAAFGPGAESPGPSKTPQPSEPMGGTRKKVKFTGKKFEKHMMK